MALTLAECKTAIEEVAKYGQYVSSEGYTYRRADLATLMKLQQSLEIESSQSTSYSIFDRTLSAIPRRS